uniref:Si:dkey-98j1.5 n=1 Tax=Lepisosteus oculatus TaxID=7918 RepID=W5MKB9_LEPOC
DDTAGSSTHLAPSSSSAAATRSYTVSFPEFFEYLFGEDEGGVGVSDSEDAVVSFADEDASSLSVPEMYDYFFSEFETEGLFLPAVWRSRENVACSRPPDEDLLLPETSDCLFPEDEPRAVGDEESCGPVRVVTRLKDSAAGPLAVSGPDAYEHFFAGSEWERNSPWRNFTSLRRRCFTRGSENARGDSSSSLLPKKEVPRGYTERRSGNSPSVIHFLKDQILRHLEEQRSRSTDPSSAVAVPTLKGTRDFSCPSASQTCAWCASPLLPGC